MKSLDCILCGSALKDTIAVQSFKDLYLELIDPKYQNIDRKLVSCQKCGFVYHDPQLDDRDALILYEKFRDFTFRNESDDDYFDRITSYPESESENHHKFEWIRNIDSNFINRGGDLLDVGCGGGVFIYTFLKNAPGWDAWGVEPTPAFAELAQRRLNRPIVASTYKANIFPGKKFNLITVNQVLEHVVDPLGFLKDIKDELVDEGLLYIEVPDVSDLESLPVDHDRFQMQHLWIFSVDTLTKLCESAGLRKIKIETVKTIRERNNVVGLFKKI
jgi:2-polyprenyl-3-methyl-5-hydroxy-6-metoxy-1,4-benzoquinol methylase